MIVELPHRQGRITDHRSQTREDKQKLKKARRDWPVAMGGEEFQPKSFSKVYTEFHIDKAKYESQKSLEIFFVTCKPGLKNLRRIGAGGFGKVYLVARRSDGTLYAAKYQKIKDKRTQRLVGIPEMILNVCCFTIFGLSAPPPD